MSQFASQRGITQKEPGKYHQFPAVGIPYYYNDIPLSQSLAMRAKERSRVSMLRT